MNKILTMKRFLLLTIIPFFLLAGQRSSAQDTKKLNLDQVIQIAEEQSPNALMAKHRFRSSYWQFRSYQAQFRPTLALKGTLPGYINGPQRVYKNGQFEFAQVKEYDNIGTLSLSQAIGFTGTTISLFSSLEHTYNLYSSLRQFDVSPVNISIDQPIRKYNSLKWQTKIEPVKYAAAKKTFLSNIEGVHSSAVQYFFALALAQINKQISVMNLANADTLYRIAQGRYNLGMIAEDDLLQMQLTYLNAVTDSKTADMNLADREIRLRSFLGYNDNVKIELELPSNVPNLQVDVKEVLDLAMANNPDIVTQQLNILSAQSNLAQAKAQKGFNASLGASLGYNQTATGINTAMNDLLTSQRVNLTFSMPILDWGRGKGNYKMAQSSLELAQVQAQQAITDFQQNLTLDVEQFNLQKNQVEIAAKSDTVARRMYEVTKQRFLIGKIAILDLNNADTKKDQNRRAYVQALQNYWSYFFNIRTLALYDFVGRKPLETDYERLLQ
jgi:outer membrane protein TolC